MSDESLLSGQAPTDTGVQQPTDAAVKPQDNAAPVAEAQAPAADKPQEEGAKAPESYQFELPEGFELNGEVAEQFTTWAKDLNLPQDKAQAVAAMGAQLVQQAQAAQQEAWAAQVADWRKEVETDKEFGGPALAENLGYAARAIDTFAPELREVLDSSGMGNHPVLVKAFIRIGKAISEDRLVGGAQQSPGVSADPAKRLFPNMN